MRLARQRPGAGLPGASQLPARQLAAGRPGARPARRRHGCRVLAAAGPLQGLLHQAAQPVPGFAAGVLANSAVFAAGAAVLLKGLTPTGVLHSWFLGTTIFAAFGWRGYLIVCLYFLLGTAVTKVRLKQKEAEGIAERRSGRRTPGSVWGSGLAGVACALAALSTQHHPLWRVGFVASFVSKFSDTVSSELGKAFGRTTYLSTSFRRVPRGTEGAVSVEGTAAGVAAALGFAGIACALGLVCRREAVLVALAAVVANYLESLLGALLQGREGFAWLGNDAVNMLQICVAAYLAMWMIDF